MTTQWEMRDRQAIAETNEAISLGVYYMGGQNETWDAENTDKSIRVQSKTCKVGGTIVIHPRDLSEDVSWLVSTWKQEKNVPYIKEDSVEIIYIPQENINKLYEAAIEKFAILFKKNPKNDGITFTFPQIKKLYDPEEYTTVKRKK